MIRLLRKMSVSISSSVSNLDQRSSVMMGSPGSSSLGMPLQSPNDSLYPTEQPAPIPTMTTTSHSRPTYKDFDMPKSVVGELNGVEDTIPKTIADDADHHGDNKKSTTKAKIHRLSEHKP